MAQPRERSTFKNPVLHEALENAGNQRRAVFLFAFEHFVEQGQRGMRRLPFDEVGVPAAQLAKTLRYCVAQECKPFVPRPRCRRQMRRVLNEPLDIAAPTSLLE